MGLDIFSKEEKKLPGVSPIAKMIQGDNDPLLYSQFSKNYGYKVDEVTQEDDEVELNGRKLPKILKQSIARIHMISSLMKPSNSEENLLEDESSITTDHRFGGHSEIKKGKKGIQFEDSASKESINPDVIMEKEEVQE